MLAPPHSLHWCTQPPVLADAGAAALLAFATLPPVLADACAAALLASATLPPVLADACAAALLALATLPPVLADAAPPHSLHLLTQPPVLADACAAALLALVTPPPVLADACAAALLASADAAARARRCVRRRTPCIATLPPVLTAPPFAIGNAPARLALGPPSLSGAHHEEQHPFWALGRKARRCWRQITVVVSIIHSRRLARQSATIARDHGLVRLDVAQRHIVAELRAHAAILLVVQVVLVRGLVVMHNVDLALYQRERPVQVAPVWDRGGGLYRCVGCVTFTGSGQSVVISISSFTRARQRSWDPKMA